MIKTLRICAVLAIVATQAVCQTEKTGSAFTTKREQRRLVPKAETVNVSENLKDGEMLAISPLPADKGQIAVKIDGILQTPSDTITYENFVFPVGTQMFSGKVGKVDIALTSTQTERLTATMFAVVVTPKTTKAISLQIAYDSPTSFMVIGQDVGFSLAALDKSNGQPVQINNVAFEVTQMDSLGLRSNDVFFSSNFRFMPAGSENDTSTHLSQSAMNNKLAQSPQSEVVGYLVNKMVLRGPRTVELSHGGTYRIKATATLVTGELLTQYQSFVYQQVARVRAAAATEATCEQCFSPKLEESLPVGQYRLTAIAMNQETHSEKVLAPATGWDPQLLKVQLPSEITGSPKGWKLTYSLVRLKDEKIKENVIIQTGTIPVAERHK